MSGGPPILPMYKTQIKKTQGIGHDSINGMWSPSKFAIIGILSAIFIFCFVSTYFTFYFVQSMSDKMPGIPNTRNIIQKWSIDHFHGLDITELGRPPKLAAKISQHMQEHIQEHERVMEEQRIALKAEADKELSLNQEANENKGKIDESNQVVQDKDITLPSEEVVPELDGPKPDQEVKEAKIVEIEPMIENEKQNALEQRPPSEDKDNIA